MNEHISNMDRRGARRFQFGWELTMAGSTQTGAIFAGAGRLLSLSSRGAFASMGATLPVGSKLEVQIKLPLKAQIWLRYSAVVVRFVSTGPVANVAVKFESARPKFVIDLASSTVGVPGLQLQDPLF